MALLDERNPDAVTVQKLSIERIAREAGVSKTTIYRWWPSKAAVVIDTFLDNHVAKTLPRDDLPAIDALREHAASVARIYSGHEGRLVAQLIAECQYDALTLAEFKERFWRHRRAAVTALVERAVAEGSIRSSVDPDTVADLLYSPIYFRLLFQSAPLDRASMEKLFSAALEGIANPSAPRDAPQQ